TVHFYPEGDQYPEVTVSQALDFDTQLTLNGSLASLGCNYLRIHPQTPGNRLVITPTFSDPYHALCGYAYDIRQQHSQEVTAGHVQQSVATVAGMSDLWILPLSLRSPYASSQPMTFQISLDLGEPGALSSKIDLVYPNPYFWEPAKEIVFEYQISVAAEDVQMVIMTEQGTFVRSRSLGPCARGWNSCRWDGRDEKGHPAATGIYLCLLKTSSWQEYCKFALIR
nr:FlgD immunoglobulin-like domain containing protein [bacterium]